MFTLSESAAAFAQIDGTTEDGLPTYDKAIRNLSQRIYLPPADRPGKADRYARHTICALRLAQKASIGFGLDRPKVETLARWLQTQPTGPARRLKVDGGFRTLTPIEEAVERVEAGQEFDVRLTLYRNGRIVPSTDWADDDQETATVVEKVFASASEAADDNTPPEDARFTLPASRLIAEVLKALGA